MVYYCHDVGCSIIYVGLNNFYASAGEVKISFCEWFAKIHEPLCPLLRQRCTGLSWNNGAKIA